jgi:putative peptide zinc metalloprotease protein
MSYYESPSGFSGTSYGPGFLESGPPKLRSDLIIREQVHKSEVYYVVKDPIVQAYYKLSPIEWDLLSLFDGTREVDEIIEQFNKKHPFEMVDEESLASYQTYFKDLDLLVISTAEKSLMLMERIRTQRKMRASGEDRNLFYMTFSAWDPDRYFDRIIPHVRFFWTKGFFIFSLCLISIMLAINIAKWDELKQGTLALYSFTNKSLWDILVFIVMMTATGTIHEIGHSLTLKNYGGSVRQIGFLLFYLTPAFYADVSDSYLLQSRKERLWVTFAGTYVELILCSLASIVWFFATPGTGFYDFAFKLVLFTGISSFLINMNPLIKLDGYYAVMDIVEIPDLREESFAYLENWIKKNIFRLKVEETTEGLTRRKRRIYIVYGILATAYTLLIYLLIVSWLRNIFVSTMPGFGYAVFLVVLYFMFRKEIAQGAGFLKFLYLDKRESYRKKRIWQIAGAAAFLLLLLMFVIPTHTKIQSPFLLEPSQRVDVRYLSDGFIREVLVREGQSVTEGQVLGRLSNPDLERKRNSLDAALEMSSRQLAELGVAGDSSEYQEKLRTTDQQTKEREMLELRITALTLRAPLAGIVATPRVEDKVGAYAPVGSLFCDVDQTNKMKVRIPVPDYEIEDVAKGQKVELKVGAYASETFTGVVDAVSPAAGERVNAIEGAFTPFAVTVLIDNSKQKLLPGMSGTAKIVGARRSVGVRVAREIRRWIESRVW